ncbi:MAG: hypothetical protein FWG50_07170 [Kiritimatiellaeota bacterium]|nr:hypothetical protein [Kiritimatiellota bacterium]
MKVKRKAKGKAGRKRGGVLAYPGIARHAEALGVERTHLWRVLTGRRESRSLISRYKAIIEAAHRGGAK